MSLRHLNSFILALFIAGCASKDCKEITEEDIIGFYVSMNHKNKGLQYLEILKGGFYTNTYCHEGKLVEEKNKWTYSKNCSVTLAEIYWLNNPFNTIRRGGANFAFERNKILSLGEDDLSFKKVRNKPELNCEK